jgi:ribonuclease HII
MPPKFDRRLPNEVRELPPAPDFFFEAQLWEKGTRWVAGVDEAGRGALAGPVAAAALVFPPDASLAPALFGVRDSKQMTSSQRESWAPRLQAIALAWGVGFASSEEIDRIGILPATRLAIARALEQLTIMPEHLLVDYLLLPDIPLPQTALVKGDQRALSIAAASILAKTARDACLRLLEQEYPGYGLARHKGYGTAAHRAALERLGPSPIHRLSFRFRSSGQP